MDPQVTINDVIMDNYCNSSQCNITTTPQLSPPQVGVEIVLDCGLLPPDNYTFRLCMLFNGNVSHAEKYNHVPTCAETHITIQGQQVINNIH